MWIFLDCLLNDAAIVIKRNRVYATIEFLICLCGASSNSELVGMGHFHDDDIWLQLPEFISFFLSYLNLSILLRFKKQQPKFTQENNKLKNSGSCSKMTSSSDRPNAVSNVALTEIAHLFPQHDSQSAFHDNNFKGFKKPKNLPAKMRESLASRQKGRPCVISFTCPV